MSCVAGQDPTPPPAEGVRLAWPELQPNPDAAAAHRREARIVQALPAEAPVPRLLWSYDEGDAGWVALQPAPPGLPTLRAFQAAQGIVARRWVAQRTGWT